jgi:hypothetical protein
MPENGVMGARFFRSDAFAETRDLDPEREFHVSSGEGFQLTYHALRTNENGETVAWFDSAKDSWVVRGSHDEFSDVVLYT